MTSEVNTFGFQITCAQVASLIIYCGALRLFAHGQSDGLFALSSWPTVLRVSLPFALVVLVAIPTLIYAFSNAAGGILAWLEGWTFMEGFEYVIGNLQNIPFISLIPKTLTGKIFDSVICILAVTFETMVMGICAQMHLVTHNRWLLSDSFANFLCMFAAITVFIVIFVFVFSIFLAAAEDISLEDAFFYLISQVGQIQNPLSSRQLNTQFGLYVSGYSTVVGLSLAGAIVGILGAHPLVLRLVNLLETSSERDPIPSGDKNKEQGLANDRVNELERKVEELQGNLSEKNMQCEKLQNSCTLLEADNAKLNELQRKIEELQGSLFDTSIQCEKLRPSGTVLLTDDAKLEAEIEIPERVSF